MPIPIPRPQPEYTASPLTATPYYAREHQDWATEQERDRHNEALYWVGEWVMVFLMWTVIDFEKNLVERCKVCFQSGSPLDNRITDVYKQPTKQKCPDCLGTTFEGGYRARIVRPAIISDVDEDKKTTKRGEAHPAQINVETTVDFRLRPGDWMVRADNSRWYFDVPRRTTLRTGFEHPSQARTGVSYSSIKASFEEPTQIIYSAPPVRSFDVAAVLTQPVSFPADFTGFEQFRAPLLPPSFMD